MSFSSLWVHRRGSSDRDSGPLEPPQPTTALKRALKKVHADVSGIRSGELEVVVGVALVVTKLQNRPWCDRALLFFEMQLVVAVAVAVDVPAPEVQNCSKIPRALEIGLNEKGRQVVH